jgi:peroxiredoxin
MGTYRITAIAVLFLLHAHLCHGLDVGDAAKDFALKDAGGGIVTLRSLMQGHAVTVLEFLSIYCDACQKKVPQLNSLARKYDAGRLRIIAIALANEQPEVTAAMNQWGVAYSFLADPEKSTFHLYGIHKVPRFFIIDQGGTIRYSGTADDFSGFEKAIEGLLSQPTAQRKMLQPGDDAPPLKLTDKSGTARDVRFADRQHMTVIGFFTAADSVNKKQADMLSRVHDAYQKAGILVYGVGTGAFKGDLAAFVKEAAPRFPLLADAGDGASGLYGVTGGPEIVLIRPSGHIAARNAPQDYDDLAKMLDVPEPEAQAVSHEQQIMQALKKAMPDARFIAPVRLPEGTVYVGTDGGGKKTYARVVKKDILCEVCTDVEFIATLDQQGRYRCLVLVQPFEVYGKTVDATKFLQQFEGRSCREKLSAGSNADIISGATKSSLKLIEGLNETEKAFAEIQADPAFDSTFRQSVCFQFQSEIELALQKYAGGRATQSKTVDLSNLAAYCPEKKLPACPSSGIYKVTVLNGIPRIMCTVHGVDPQSTMTH